MRCIVKRACSSFHQAPSSAYSVVCGATFLRMKFRAAASLSKTPRQCLAVALADHNHDPPLAGLMAALAPVNAIHFAVRRLDVAAEIAAVDFRPLALAADRALANLGSHRFPELMRQHERGFVGRAEVAAESQHALALNLIAEDRDGEEITPERQFAAPAHYGAPPGRKPF